MCELKCRSNQQLQPVWKVGPNNNEMFIGKNVSNVIKLDKTWDHASKMGLGSFIEHYSCGHLCTMVVLLTGLKVNKSK